TDGDFSILLTANLFKEDIAEKSLRSIFMGYNVEPLRTQEEMTELRSALKEGINGERNQFILLLGINTGLRISDLVHLKVGNVRGKSYTDITEQKTGKTRRVHLRSLAGDIADYCDGKTDDEPLFPSRKGNHPISTIQAYRILTNAGDWIGRH